MKEHVDHVEFHNLGKDGKEIVLVKFTQTRAIDDYYRSCELEPYAPPQADRNPARIPVSITVAPIRPDQAVEVCKTLYRAYGYTYFYPLFPGAWTR
jgi:serine/threonine-protein kinase RsbW